jgi:hypothetical protein
MPALSPHLLLPRCPHCQIDNPNLTSILQQTANSYPFFQTVDHQNTVGRLWKIYRCSRCGGLILAGGSINIGANYTQSIALANSVQTTEIYPQPTQVDASLPSIAREYLTQAINSIHAPAGSVMLCASAVDAMLKNKGYVDPKQSLYKRIEQAAVDHLITESMKDWAHEVRLDANDQRHADQGAAMPTTADAQRSIEFAQALGQFLFALPARVAQGRAAAQSASATPGDVAQVHNGRRTH